MTAIYILISTIAFLTLVILALLYKDFMKKKTDKLLNEKEIAINENANRIINKIMDGQNEKEIINTNTDNQSQFDSTIELLHKHSIK